MLKTHKIDYKKICIIIPAFNEEESIAQVIREIRKVSKKLKIVVVNDGSYDNTLLVAYKAKVTVLDLPINSGIGAAVQTGLVYAKNMGYEIAVQIDADGQHNPSDLPTLLNNLTEKVDIIIGSRFIKNSNYKIPFIRLIGIKFFSFLIALTCKQKVYDPTSGFRVYGKNSINLFNDNYPIEFPEPRSIVNLLKNGLMLKEIPVNMRQRIGGVSSISNLYSLYIILPIAIAIIFQSIQKKQ